MIVKAHAIPGPLALDLARLEVCGAAPAVVLVPVDVHASPVVAARFEHVLKKTR